MATSRRSAGSAALALVLLAASATGVAAQPGQAGHTQQTELSDIAGTTHEQAIRAIAGAGVVSGYPDGTFRPEARVTRGQMASVLAGALELDSGPPLELDDVDGTTHEPGIRAVVAAGIVSGFPDATFRPSVGVTRGQMATFLANGFGLDDDGEVRFTDVAGTTHAGGIAAVTGAGIAAGFPDATFRPGATVTRGQLATFLARALGLIDPIAPPPPAPDSDPEPEPEPAPAPEDPGVPLAPSGTTFGDGIMPRPAVGTFRSAAEDGCYWARLAGFSGELDDIIANSFSRSPSIVTIAADDAGFESSRCGTWRAVQDTYPTAPATSFGDGDHVVGRHIQPGTYRANPTESCYHARLSGFSGQLSDIIANNNTREQVVVTIAEGDVGFTSSRCGTWTRQ